METDPERLARERPRRPGSRIGICVSRFHEELTGAMLRSARAELAAGGVADEDVVVAHAPGSFELPLLARRLAERPDIDAVLCLGLVLKGETTHDEHVARGAVDGIQRVMADTGKPVLLGILTCQTLEQARVRALPLEEGGGQDKGREVARAALEILLALDALDAGRSPVGFPSPSSPPQP